MGREVHKTPVATKGSRKWLQILVNCCPELLEEQILCKLSPSANEVDWRSPLESDDYAEYYDQDFVDKLGLSLDSKPLGSFWPRSGPRWDGLGVTNKGQVLLVEAKAHVRELRTSMNATSDSSINRIMYSLSDTKAFMRADARAGWTRPFYQHANRLAHLYLLHVLNHVKAYLVNVYLLNDEDMKDPNTIVPQTIREWECAILTEEMALGIRSRHGLSSRIVNVFIDVEDIKRQVAGC